MKKDVHLRLEKLSTVFFGPVEPLFNLILHMKWQFYAHC